MKRRRLVSALLASCLPLARAPLLAGEPPAALRRAVDAAARSAIGRNDLPGLAVGVTSLGTRHVFNYGVASRQDRRAVNDDTLFELGSISKVFTATLGAYARETGRLSFADPASRHWPGLGGSAFDRISLLDLATYTAGGLPLQFPDEVTDADSMLRFYRAWKPAYAAGTQRLYSNPSIGLFGYLVARSLGEPFDALLEHKLFPSLGMHDTFVRVPPQRMADYAFGYLADGRAVRANPGVFDSEAYGVKTTASDMLRFVEADIDAAGLETKLQRALLATRQAYYQAAPLQQGLAWEMYDDPVPLAVLLAGNGGDMAYRPHAVQRFVPPLPARRDVLVDKTGSTNGFGAYVAFVPAREAGVVVLANRNFPIADRVRLAFSVLQALDPGVARHACATAASPPARSPRDRRAIPRSRACSGPAR